MTWVPDPLVPTPAPGSVAELFPPIEHLDGVSWFDSAPPRRGHECKAQTRGYSAFRLVERCACGAYNIDHHGWIERNTRTRPEPEPEPEVGITRVDTCRTGWRRLFHRHVWEPANSRSGTDPFRVCFKCMKERRP